LCADEGVTHYWLPRRWLFPDASTYLDESPWRPDYQLRLVRTDPRFIRFSDEFHRPVLAEGPGRFPQLPLWHVDPLLRSFEQRLEKARRYERLRPGMRIGGRALNFAFYVPELRHDPRLARLPPEERAHVEAVLAAARPSGHARAKVSKVTREEIDAHWPATAPEAQAGRLGRRAGARAGAGDAGAVPRRDPARPGGSAAFRLRDGVRRRCAPATPGRRPRRRGGGAGRRAADRGGAGARAGRGRTRRARPPPLPDGRRAERAPGVRRGRRRPDA